MLCSTGAVNCRSSQQGYNLTLTVGEVPTVSFPISGTPPVSTGLGIPRQILILWEFRLFEVLP